MLRPTEAPDPALVQLASEILAAQKTGDFVACAAEVGKALWTGDEAGLQSLAAAYGMASVDQCAARLAAGTERRAELKHYSGAMFYYGGEWYWGVDRLYHLEKRLATLGADRQPGQPMIVPRPDVELDGPKDSGTLTLEVYPSLRSPYTSIVFDRAVKLARDTGVNLSVRPVLPMVMRGVPATREKGFYIFMDAAREAREAGVPYGNFYDPIGDPARHCYSLYPWAVEQGRGVELLSSFLSHAFAQGVNTNNDRGLRKVVEAAGLDWNEAQHHLGEAGWEDVLEKNRLAMYDAGLWGVPSLRLLDEQGNQILALWGQDRLWLFAREIQRHLNRR
jgi:2-hydroxychromene-2-carboxylate isomerase